MRTIPWIFLFLVCLQETCWPIDDLSPQRVHSSLRHVDIGILLPIPIPSIGLGYRFQEDHHGGAVSVHGGSIGDFSQVKGAILYHYYPHPSNESQLYLGCGVGGSWTSYNIFLNRGRSFCLSPEFALGKQFKTDAGKTRFWQLQVSVPTYFFREKGWLGCPIIALYYGFCF